MEKSEKYKQVYTFKTDKKRMRSKRTKKRLQQRENKMSQTLINKLSLNPTSKLNQIHRI